jgi:hypothetical protein
MAKDLLILEPFDAKVAALQYRGRVSKGVKRYPVYGICHIKDLRPKGERVSLEPETVVEGGLKKKRQCV